MSEKKQKAGGAGAQAVRPLPRGLKGALPAVLFALFAAFAYWLLAVKNPVYLYAVQEHSLFVNDDSFFADKMKVPGGFAAWVGCYLTQFFYYPWAGALIIILLWLAIYVAIFQAFRLPSKLGVLALVPLFALLVSVVDLGYWLFYLKLPGYWFSQSVSVLMVVLALWLHERLPLRLRLVWMLVWMLAFYPLVGFWALAGGVLMALRALSGAPARRGKAWLPLLLAAAVSAVLPLLYYQLYVRTRLEDMWIANFPIFRNDNVTSGVLTVPFVVIAGCLLLLACVPWEKLAQLRSNRVVLFGSFGLLSGLAYLTNYCSYDNYNYNAELRMYRAIQKADFGRVLEEAAAAPGPMTRQMVVSKNIALMNLGRCGTDMFRYDNSGEPPYVFDSLRVHLVQTAGPMIYLNYGKANFACRWAIENSVEFAFNVDNLKTLVRCAMLCNEAKVAMKYIDILRATTFHRRWADERLAMLHDRKLYRQSADYKYIEPLRCYENTLDGDEGLVEMYLINYFSHMHRKEPKFQEQTLVFALIQKDIQLFWPRFFNYATLHEQEQMPIHYQEAAFLYGNLEHEVDISRMPFDEERVVARYASFQQTTQSLLRGGMSAEEVGRATRSTFGDTFWWFYFFCRNIQSY